MSNKLKVVLASSLLASAFSMSSALACPGKAQTSDTATQKAAPLHVATASFQVSDMSCEGCGDKVKEALNKVKGVYKVDVKMADHRVIVSFDSDKTTADKVAKAITAAGYTPTTEA